MLNSKTMKLLEEDKLLKVNGGIDASVQDSDANSGLFSSRNLLISSSIATGLGAAMIIFRMFAIFKGNKATGIEKGSYLDIVGKENFKELYIQKLDSCQTPKERSTLFIEYCMIEDWFWGKSRPDEVTTPYEVKDMPPEDVIRNKEIIKLVASNTYISKEGNEHAFKLRNVWGLREEINKLRAKNLSLGPWYKDFYEKVRSSFEVRVNGHFHWVYEAILKETKHDPLTGEDVVLNNGEAATATFKFGVSNMITLGEGCFQKTMTIGGSALLVAGLSGLITWSVTKDN